MQPSIIFRPMAKSKEPAQPSYEQALNELRKIAEAIENESVSIDELADKVKRASELVEYCREKLRNTEAELDKVIGKMGK
jgi:exodeoxyribonuclease VII small subunit